MEWCPYHTWARGALGGLSQVNWWQSPYDVHPTGIEPLPSLVQSTPCSQPSYFVSLSRSSRTHPKNQSLKQRFHRCIIFKVKALLHPQGMYLFKTLGSLSSHRRSLKILILSGTKVSSIMKFYSCCFLFPSSPCNYSLSLLFRQCPNFGC